MKLAQAFRIQPKSVVALVGGGGKTTALFRLADELAAQNRRVITTTTTRIFAAQIKLAPYVLPFSTRERAGGEGEFIARVRDSLKAHPHILIVSETNEEGRRPFKPEGPKPSERESGGKAFGVPPELVDQLIALDEVDAVIYEADGSRMRPFKAPALHEPVLAARTTLLVPVIGITARGAALDEEQVHRAEIVARLAGARIGDTVTAEMIARVIAHPEGGLKNKPREARALVLINQVETAEQLESAREISRLLLESDAIDAVAMGAVQSREQPIRETHRRVAAIVTAAGAGTRMQGRIKQLLPWRGKTLIENAIEIATQSKVNETMVVLGAQAEEIRPVIEHTNARVIVNRGWEEGHASSIRAALDAIAPTLDAAIFINADQPWLTPDVINGIIQRYRETDAEIIAPTYAGKRASPVLFRRVHFDELRSLRGEQGGRELIAKYPERVERVEFDDARLGVDVDTVEEYEQLVTRDSRLSA